MVGTDRLTGGGWRPREAAAEETHAMEKKPAVAEDEARPQGEQASENDLLGGPLRVVNVGLSGFAQDLEALGVDVVHVDWAPPAAGDVGLGKILSRLGT